MAPEKRQKAKTQTLSLRLDPKTRFVLEFMAKIRRQSITTVVEDAIRYTAKDTTVGHESDERTWEAYWDTSDGVRAMLILADRKIPSTFEDDELRSFLKAHIEFFSADFDLDRPDRINVDIIWPRIDEYLTMWLETKRSEPWAAGHQMAYTLQSAGIDAPEWPRAKKEPPEPKRADFGGGGDFGRSGGSFDKEIDDEIPF